MADDHARFWRALAAETEVRRRVAAAIGPSLTHVLRPTLRPEEWRALGVHCGR